MFYKKRIEELERRVLILEMKALLFKKDSPKKGKPKAQKSKKRITAYHSFRKKVSDFLESADMPRVEFARQAKVSPGTLRNLFLGKRMNKATVARISLFMDRHSNF